MANKGNWMVRVYNQGGDVCDSWVIKDRTEDEARREAEADIQKAGGMASAWDKIDDWTMIPFLEKK